MSPYTPAVVKSAMVGFTKRVITMAKQRRRKEPLQEPLHEAKYPKPLGFLGDWPAASRANHLVRMSKCKKIQKYYRGETTKDKIFRGPFGVN